MPKLKWIFLVISSTVNPFSVKFARYSFAKAREKAEIKAEKPLIEEQITLTVSGKVKVPEDKNPFERIITCIDAAAESTLFVDHGIDLLTTKAYPNDAKVITKLLGLKEITAEKGVENKADPKPKKSKAKKSKGKELA